MYFHYFEPFSRSRGKGWGLNKGAIGMEMDRAAPWDESFSPLCPIFVWIFVFNFFRDKLILMEIYDYSMHH